jgi:hypothetical protein
MIGLALVMVCLSTLPTVYDRGPAGAVTDDAYDERNLSTVSYPNSTGTTYEYDHLKRMTKVINADAGGTTT